MHDARHRRTSAVVDVRHRAGDGSRGRDTAEDGREQVGDTLTDQFLVGVMLVADEPSATVAESSDSMAPRMAMVMAGEMRSLTVSHVSTGTLASGSGS